jgi:hypothetical protein
MKQPTAGVYPVGGVRASVNAKTFTLSDFELNVASGDTKDMTADGNFETLYELDIDDGLGEVFGRGRSANPLQAEGFVATRFVDDTAANVASGRFRLAVRNAQGRRLYNLYEADLSTVDSQDGAGNLKSRRDREPFPLTAMEFETEPHVITIDLNVTEDITVDNTEADTSLEADGFRAEALE